MMLYMGGNRRDYDTWEQEFGATGWSWEEVSHRLIKMPKRLSATLHKRGSRWVKQDFLYLSA
jgi:hypothetical protein